MKKVMLLVTATVLFLTVYAPVTFARENTVDLANSSKSAVLIERDTGQILYNKDSDQELPPASMTKIMTMILIMEELDQGKIKMDEKVRTSEYAASMGGSQIFLEAGEEMTVEELLKGIAVASGNDASVAMAERISGSEPEFVKMMNEKVDELGLTGTKFQNATGLPAKDHYSTAYDMAMMAKELLKHEEITKFTSVYDDYLRKGTEDEFWLVNTNKLVKFYEGVDGLKTGFTQEAKYCLTATAKKDDMRVIAVVMGAESPKDRNADVTAMLDYAFNQYETEAMFERDELVDQLKFFKADRDVANVVTGESVSILHKKGEKLDDVKAEVVYDKDLALPIEKGAKVGTLVISSKGKTLSQTSLVVQEELNEAGVWTLFKRSMKEMVKQR
ncbi:D-alanyl-D-alanine carboxypeptidase [Pontibacillus halophilus JSM 076056 = DSM 19796]|uniref:serine-type D-Ala-D-Ala carboxypeptidase n=1 Tax=Pontibacillus halophilus JSM 076056 = DSM 19796 TaxID=1385510 RepID=A0A0A5GJP9_9BACI|nr:D-alanyl-D-alanine carboxypeptidase family protein [Pontibacillus halophilus]KGX92229.1 D-alanyl-D-alanine carboxypeptidase [Pontibacillus halophilus JSM 076056 = DSM 19796]